jgi:hypothetical protein
MKISFSLDEIAALQRAVETGDIPDAQRLPLLAKLEQAEREAVAVRVCPVCGEQFTGEKVGRTGVYCGSRCRQKAYRQRSLAAKKAGARPPGGWLE